MISSKKALVTWEKILVSKSPEQNYQLLLLAQRGKYIILLKGNLQDNQNFQLYFK